MVMPATIGRYEIRSELGRGGMAAVFRGYDPHFDRDVAIKVLPSEYLHDPDFRARFEREAKTIATLEHPAVVPVYDFGEEDGRLFLVMRLMTGGSLAGRLQGKPMAAKEVSHILTRISSALDVAHAQGIIHRDLKPGNILFDQYGEAYLSDFGIARLSEAHATLTGSKAALGTPGYMSPEQIQGDEVDSRSDIYALGAMLFEMLTGKRPFAADSPAMVLVRQMTEPAPHIREIQPDLPLSYDEVIARSMARERENRPDTAGELASLLDAATPGSAEEAIKLTTAAELIAQVQREEAASQPTVVETGPTAASEKATGEELYDDEIEDEVDEEAAYQPTVVEAASGIAPAEAVGEELSDDGIENEIDAGAGTPASDPTGAALADGQLKRPRKRRWLLVVAALAVLAVVVLWVMREQGILPSTVKNVKVLTPAASHEASEIDTALLAEPNADEPDLNARQEALLRQLEAGNFEGAVREANKILEDNDQLPVVYLLRGAAYRELGEFDEAAADFNRAIELNPDDPTAHRELSSFYLERQDLERALFHINAVIEQNPLDYTSYYQRGVILREMGDIRAAIQNFRLFLDMVPFDDCPECHEDAKEFLDGLPERVNLVLDKPVTASSEMTPPTLATDGNIDTAWEASAGTSQWIEIDFQMAAEVNLLQLIPMQESSGHSVIRILGRMGDGELQVLDEFAGITRDGGEINFSPEPPWLDVHALRIQTEEIPVRVAWREIRAFGRESERTERSTGETEPPRLGEETIPLEELAPEIPWLPLDADQSPATFLVVFNLEQEPYDNLFLRRALALALDREHLARVAQESGFTEPRGATTFTHPNTMGRDLYSDVGISFEPDMARALLAEAGFPDGEGLPPVILTANSQPQNEVIMDAVADMWGEILGIEVEIALIEGEYLSRVEAERPGIYQAEWIVELNDPDNTLRETFYSEAAFNLGGFSRRDYDVIVQEAAELAGDPAARQHIYIRAEQILNEEEAAIIPLFHFYDEQ